MVTTALGVEAIANAEVLGSEDWIAQHLNCSWAGTTLKKPLKKIVVGSNRAYNIEIVCVALYTVVHAAIGSVCPCDNRSSLQHPSREADALRSSRQRFSPSGNERLGPQASPKDPSVDKAATCTSLSYSSRA